VGVWYPQGRALAASVSPYRRYSTVYASSAARSAADPAGGRAAAGYGTDSRRMHDRTAVSLAWSRSRFWRGVSM
jgi:hypothetical protein